MRLDNSIAKTEPGAPKAEPGTPSNVEAAIDQRLAEIDALVESEDFAAIERLIRSLPDLAASVPGESREAVLLKIRKFLAGVHAQAESKSEHIRARLETLKSGRAANNAYAAARGLV
jgi:hypothetical protein